MCECWATNPDSRPTFTEILQELKKFSQVSKRCIKSLKLTLCHLKWILLLNGFHRYELKWCDCVWHREKWKERQLIQSIFPVPPDSHSRTTKVLHGAIPKLQSYVSGSLCEWGWKWTHSRLGHNRTTADPTLSGEPEVLKEISLSQRQLKVSLAACQPPDRQLFLW